MNDTVLKEAEKEQSSGEGAVRDSAGSGEDHPTDQESRLQFLILLLLLLADIGNLTRQVKRLTVVGVLFSDG